MEVVSINSAKWMGGTRGNGMLGAGIAIAEVGGFPPSLQNRPRESSDSCRFPVRLRWISKAPMEFGMLVAKFSERSDGLGLGIDIRSQIIQIQLLQLLLDSQQCTGLTA